MHKRFPEILSLVGSFTNYFKRIGVSEFFLESGHVKAGDTLIVTGPLCGMVKEKAKNFRVNCVECMEATKGDKLTFPFTTKVTGSDKLYKIIEEKNA